VLLVNAWRRIDENRESDIKYRHLKLYTDKNIRDLIRYEDSIYLADPDVLRKYVIGEEARRKEKAELLLLSKEKEEESKQLKKKAENK
jgi:hypothetical protein